MNRRTKKAVVTAALFGLGILASRESQAQISLTTAGSGSYSQNFDGLSNSTLTPTQTWSDNLTLAGWYSSRTTYVVNNGSSNSGQLYSYGTVSATERALGAVASGTSGTIFYGARFQNNTGATNAIDTFSVAYTGEQWRDGGNTSGIAHTTNFQWSVDATSITAGTWNDFDSLDFTSPTHPAVTVGQALDGNNPLNQTVFSLSQIANALNLAPGAEIWIRWKDDNDTGNDHGMGVDDFTFSYTTSPFVNNSRNLTWDANTGTALAQEGAGTWTNAGNNWFQASPAGNVVWSSTNPDDATFGAGGVGSFTVTVGSAVTANKITFAPGATYAVGTPASTNVISLAQGVVGNNSGTINAPVDLTANQNWAINGSNTVTVNGAVTGQRLQKAGTGSLRLTNATNSMSGIQVDAGTLLIGSDGELGAGIVTTNGGTLSFLGSLNFPGPGGGGGGRTFTLSSGITTFDTAGNNVDIDGDLTGGGALVKAGLGTLTLSSPSEASIELRYTGTTTINAGTLKVDAEANNFAAIGGGNLTINSGGTFHIDNIKVGITTGSVSTRVFINDGGKLLGTGTLAEYNRSQDALTVQNGTISSQVHVTLATSGATDVFQIGNSIRNLTAAPNGTFEESYNTIHTSGPGRIVLHSGRENNSTAAFRGSWSLDNGTLQVGPVSSGSPAQVLNALGFRWNTSTSTAEFNPVSVNAGASLVIGADKTNPLDTVPGNATADYLSNPITLNGGKIASTAYELDGFGEQDGTQPVHAKLGGGFATTASGGTVLLYNPVQNTNVVGDDYLGPRNVHLVAGGNTTWGSGTLVMDPGAATGGKFVIERTGGTVSVTPGAKIQVNANATLELGGTAGALSDGTNHVDITNNSTTSLNVVAAAHSAGKLRGTGNTSVSGGATLTVTGVKQNVVNIPSGARLNLRAHGGQDGQIVVNTLNLNANGTLDYNDNDVVVNNAAFTDIYNAMLAGFGSSGPGLISSTSDGSQILAMFDNALVGAGDWQGDPIGANAIVGKYTYFGDANIDGQVTGDDYGVIDANLDTTPPVGLGWLSGDMNLDGSVTGDDYGVVDANLGLGVGNPLSPSSLSAVPEPASFGVLAAAGAGLLMRRRRTR